MKFRTLRADEIDVRVAEEWRDIRGYEGKYQVSNLGKVKNLKTKNILKGNYTRGYRYVVLCKNGSQSSPKVHRLVAETFVENPCGFECINHVDGDKANNHIDNLEWCTHSHNTLHSYELGLQEKQFGSKNHMYKKRGKLNAKSKPVIMKSLEGENLKRFESVELAVSWLKQRGHPKARSSSISQCARGIKYKKAYGYKWEYEGSDCW